MYREIEFLLMSSGLSKKDLATKLGMTYNTLLLKLRGVSKFTLDEAVLMKELLKTDLPIEKLFKFTKIAS